MYFPGDPLLDYDPMYKSIPDERARKRLVSTFDWETTIPEQALGYRFDIVLRGRDETPMENYLPPDGDDHEPADHLVADRRAVPAHRPHLARHRQPRRRPAWPATPIAIEGRVIDGDGEPVNDALVEIWQANAHGTLRASRGHAGQAARARRSRASAASPTDDDGAFRFTTIKPGRVPAPGGGLQAPHIDVTIFMRGMLKHLHHAHLLSRRSGQRRGRRCCKSVPAERRDDADREAGRAASPARSSGTWSCRATGETVFFDC